MIERTLRYLPLWLRDKIEHRHSLIQIMNNIGWLTLDKLLRMGVGLFVGVWIARYLGPDQFGLLSYVLSFVALFTSVTSLGLNTIVVRDLIKYPSSADDIMGTSFILQFIGGLCAFFLAIIAIHYFRPEDDLVKLAVTVLAMIMLLKATEVVKYWFESQIQSKYVVWTENGVFLFFSAVKIGLILAKASLMSFIWVLFFEGVALAIGLLWIYRKKGQILSFHLDLSWAKHLLKNSWPLFLSSGFVILNMNVDKVMVCEMAGTAEVGLFSAAARLTEVFYFLPVIIGASLAPHLNRSYLNNGIAYFKDAKTTFHILTFLSLFISITITLFSDIIILNLFGKSYAGASEMLKINVWASIFVFHVSIRSRLLIMENHQNLVLFFSGLTLISNIIANFILIPIAGGLGASCASLISWMLCALLFPLFIKYTRIYPMTFMKSFLFNWRSS